VPRVSSSPPRKHRVRPGAGDAARERRQASHRPGPTGCAQTTVSPRSRASADESIREHPPYIGSPSSSAATRRAPSSAASSACAAASWSSAGTTRTKFLPPVGYSDASSPAGAPGSCRVRPGIRRERARGGELRPVEVGQRGDPQGVLTRPTTPTTSPPARRRVRCRGTWPRRTAGCARRSRRTTGTRCESVPRGSRGARA
jgi:hypothetical protein